MTEQIMFSKKENGVGIATLSREKALHSLTFDMISALYTQLKRWETDENVRVILLESTGTKAFCAGGDIKALYQAKNNKQAFDQATAFFTLEYELDLYIANYPKPIVVLMDGIVMGGGVGLSYGASHRIVTERTKWAMPEVNISFFPDVGACYFLSQTPDYTGRYAALTGSVLTASDAISIGCADYYIESDTLETCKQELVTHHWDDYEEVTSQSVHLFLQSFIQEPTQSELMMNKDDIHKHFSFKTIEDILTSLHNDSSRFAQDTYTLLESKSPLSLKVTLAHLKQSKASSLEETFETDKTLAKHFLQCDDFYEGVYSILIDKSHKPVYSYETVAEVPDELALSFFREH
ncbi:enoyl-CoA hydratase/isomerase family protein [Shouchella lehensis]|uniref:3-hydroxyisobutyryl-CoA hydrolase n=1 Tax=Shouchella lehensis TaxID=300825 RepID=A0A4Y7WQB1_9BACI|nr:enoyl-CoA hydratase/isomerase family protein [Shouchella lehensis]MBG9784439.1 3-hydroxyisobutyryl-CoA hydrolase [Shouchella lehensis]TES50557.1 enoyl-CoA hydratase/isomerase family protein [Shouchella lehensis]